MDKILSCPRCSILTFMIPLRKIKHPSGAILDVCNKCNGMWLDGPEVESLYNASKNSVTDSLSKNKKVVKSKSVNNKLSTKSKINRKITKKKVKNSGKR